jgi:hypothetical protein
VGKRYLTLVIVIHLVGQCLKFRIVAGMKQSRQMDQLIAVNSLLDSGDSLWGRPVGKGMVTR